MRKRSKYLTLSFFAHLVGMLILPTLFESGITSGQLRNANPDTNRRESIRLAIALNSMKRIEQSLAGKATNPRELAVSYEELTKLSDSEIAERAITLQTEISRSTVRQSYGSASEEILAGLSNAEQRKQIQSIIQSGDRAALIEEIEIMAAETKLAASSLDESQALAEAGTRRDNPIPSGDKLSRGPTGMDLTDTLRYDSLVGSRFRESGIGAGIWSYVDSWYILGPIPKEQPLYSESRIEFNLSKRFSLGRSDSSAWEYMICDGPALALPKDDAQQTYFLYSELFAEEEQEVVLWLRGTDGARLWVNQNPVPAIVFHERDLGASFCIATLNRGYNSLELRVDSSGPHGYLWLAHSNQLVEALNKL